MLDAVVAAESEIASSSTHSSFLLVSRSLDIGEVAYATALDVGDAVAIHDEDAASTAIALCHPLLAP